MIEIKIIEPNDLIELASLLEELSGMKTNMSMLTKNFELMGKDADYYVLGAKIDHKLVGSVMGIICRDLVGECRPFMVVENVIVSKNFRGHGIGKKLMLELERIGKERNCYYTMFVSGAQRKEAHKFYKTIGYKLDEVQGFKKYLG